MGRHDRTEAVELTETTSWPASLNIFRVERVDDGQANMDLDTEFGESVASGRRPPSLRVWRAADKMGIGVSRRDVAGDAGAMARQRMMEAGFDVVVRQTGGTAVPQGAGVLHVSLILPRTAQAITTDAYYRTLCAPMIEWLRTHGLDAHTGPLPGSYCDGNYNILVGGRKLVGTAQAWRGGLAGVASARPGYILAQACVAVDIDEQDSAARINQFYRWSGDPYRVDATTSTSLRACLPHLFSGLTAAEAAAALAKEWLGYLSAWRPAPSASWY